MCKLRNSGEDENASLTLIMGILTVIAAYFVPLLELRGMSAYVTPAIIWLLGAVLLIKSTVMIRNSIKDKLPLILLLLLSLRLSTDVIMGLSLGFGLNLLSVNITNIVINILRTLPMIVALESLRAILASSIDRLRNLSTRSLLIILITIIMTLAYIPVTRLFSLFPLGSESAVSFAINRFFPLVAENAVLTTLAYVGGSIPSIIYVSLVRSYIFVTPVLPVQQGHIRSLAYMLTSLLQLTVLWVSRSRRLSLREVYDLILSKRSGTGMIRKALHTALIIINLAIACGIIFLLVTGARLTVVTSGSMVPTLNVGDVVLVTPARELQNGTIAVYFGERSLIIHRVIDIVQDNDTKFYIFKGDANDAADPNPVPQKYVVGKMTLKVPLVGMPVVLLMKNVGGFVTMSALLISLTVLLYIIILQLEVVKLW